VWQRAGGPWHAKGSGRTNAPGALAGPRGVARGCALLECAPTGRLRSPCGSHPGLVGPPSRPSAAVPTVAGIRSPCPLGPGGPPAGGAIDLLVGGGPGLRGPRGPALRRGPARGPRRPDDLAVVHPPARSRCVAPCDRGTRTAVLDPVGTPRDALTRWMGPPEGNLDPHSAWSAGPSPWRWTSRSSTSRPDTLSRCPSGRSGSRSARSRPLGARYGRTWALSTGIGEVTGNPHDVPRNSTTSHWRTHAGCVGRTWPWEGSVAVTTCTGPRQDACGVRRSPQTRR